MQTLGGEQISPFEIGSLKHLVTVIHHFIGRGSHDASFFVHHSE
jgi:hypothetical protein